MKNYCYNFRVVCHEGKMVEVLANSRKEADKRLKACVGKREVKKFEYVGVKPKEMPNVYLT